MPIVIFFTYIGGFLFWLLIAIFAFVAFAEYLHLLRLKGYHPPKTAWISLLLVLLLVPVSVHSNEGLITWMMPFLLLLLDTGPHRERGGASEDIATAAMGLLFISAGIFSIWMLRTESFGLLLYFFFLIWAFDTGGYVFGKFFGKRQLAPESSPKKSVEGLIGGYIFAFALSALVRYGFGAKSIIPNFLPHLITVFFVSTIAQLGDLTESAWKREARVKDSSGVFPGHGGVLDRIDSLVASAPFFLVLRNLIG